MEGEYVMDVDKQLIMINVVTSIFIEINNNNTCRYVTKPWEKTVPQNCVTGVTRRVCLWHVNKEA